VSNGNRADETRRDDPEPRGRRRNEHREQAKWAFVGAAALIPLGLLAALLQGYLTKELRLNEPKPSPTAAPKNQPLQVTAVTLVSRQFNQAWAFEKAPDAALLKRINEETRGVDPSSLDSVHDGQAEVMRRAGGVAAGQLTVELELAGNRDKPVRITDVRPVAECRPAFDGAFFHYPPLIFGPEEVAPIELDLDADLRPAPLSAPPPSGGAADPPQDYFAKKKISLQRDERLTLRVTAKAAKSYCAYRLRFQLIADDRPVTQEVDNRGRPFEVTAVSNGADSCFDYRQTHAYDAEKFPRGFWIRYTNHPYWSC